MLLREYIENLLKEESSYGKLDNLIKVLNRVIDDNIDKSLDYIEFNLEKEILNNGLSFLGSGTFR